MIYLQKKNIVFIIILSLLLFNNFIAQEINIELKTVEFEGNERFPDSELESVISQKESSWWFIKSDPNKERTGLDGLLFNILSFGAEKRYLDTLLIRNEILSLKRHYWTEGFFKVQISSEFDMNKEDSEGVLKFIISENEQSTIRAININGFDELTPGIRTNVLNQLSIDTNLTYSEKLVQENNDQILNYLGDRGRMFITSEKPNIVIDTAKNEVDINLEYDVGKSYEISDVRVERSGKGKDLVEDDLLTDIVGIEKGDRFSFYDMQRGQVRLYRTNLFSSASVSAIRSDTLNNTVPLLISAEVGSLYELSPEIIVNDDQKVFNLGLGIGFARKNFLGDARKLGINFSITSQNPIEFLQELSITNSNLNGAVNTRAIIEQPFLLGKPINTRFESYFIHQIEKRNWNANILGTKLSLDFELPRYTYVTSLKVFLNWEYSEYIYSDEYIDKALVGSVRIDTNQISYEEVKKSINNNPISNNVLLGVHIGVNKTNDFLFPTKGYNLNLILEDGNFLPYLAGKAFNYKIDIPVYYKALVKSAAYFPFDFFVDGVFGVKLVSGIIHTYQGDKELIPFNQRFTVGGSNSVRGWKTRAEDLTPKRENIDYQNLSKEDFDLYFNQNLNPGGFFILEGSFETRYKLTKEFGTALFLDYGNTWNNPRELRFDELAVAAGFGFRYYSPFAPIRVDFGFKIYDPTDRDRQFWNNKVELQIGIGEAF